MESGSRTFYLGRYNCVEQLGTGPLGDTYRAKIYGVAGFEKQFAVKRLHARLCADKAFLERFVPVASAFAALDHQRIARVHEVNAQGSHYYIVIDLVRGLDLRRILDLLRQRGEALAPDLAMLIAIEIAEGLEHAHARTNILPGGVLHLGLTAQSVMVTYEGEIKLVDVGLLAALVQPGWSDDDALAPTLAYLSPEELRGDPLDGRADLFSLGTVLHELISGSRLFLSDRSAELRAAIEGGPPPAPPADPRLQQIISCALNPDRDMRFRGATEMRAALQGILSGRVERARAELSSLIRRLAAPRDRRTGAFAAVTLPPTPIETVTPISPSRPPPVPAHVWAPPAPKPPIGPMLSSERTHNTLAGLGADDAVLTPIELVELPGIPTEKGMAVVNPDELTAGAGSMAPASAYRTVDHASTSTPLEPDLAPLEGADAARSPSGAVDASESDRPAPHDDGIEPAAIPPANGARNGWSNPSSPAMARPEPRSSEAAAGSFRAGESGSHPGAEASWSPPVVAPLPPSPEPVFAEPQQEEHLPVEAPSSPVPGVTLPPRQPRNHAAFAVIAVLLVAGAGAIYAGLNGGDATKPTPYSPTTQPLTVQTTPAGHEPSSVAKPPTAPAPVAEAAKTQESNPAPNSSTTSPTPAAVAAAPSVPATGADVAKPMPAPASTSAISTSTPATSAPTAATGATAAGATGLAIESTPPGAQVYVDGQQLGTTPTHVDMAAGTHHLVLAAEHYKLVKRDVTSGESASLQVTLEKSALSAELAGPAGLKVRCKTLGELRLLVDGEDTGLACPNEERISVKAGAHKIGLYSPRTDETHEVEHDVADGNNSTRVYTKY